MFFFDWVRSVGWTLIGLGGFEKIVFFSLFGGRIDFKLDFEGVSGVLLEVFWRSFGGC